jgi:tRNA/tmRNA/rRNA uracil-C5-methylase (TrmA/RlmC/RlmD family)
VDRRSPKPSLDPTADIPHCRHFGTCGGCSLLDQPIAWQLRDKVAACERLLAHTFTPLHFRLAQIVFVFQKG